MKTSIGIIILALSSTFAIGQAPPLEKDWVATVKVTDELAVPISGAEVVVSYFVTPTNGEHFASAQIKGLTDRKGIFTASHSDRSITLGFRSQKEGYYLTDVNERVGIPGLSSEKMIISETLVLKKIVAPIPMYASWISPLPKHVSNKAIGYDMTVGDWVAPYGKGLTPDLFMTREYNKKSAHDYVDNIKINFPNQGDGLQGFETPYRMMEGSRLRSPHQAPAGGYQAELIKEFGIHPGEESKSDYDENRNYFFRVRTVLDESGQIKSALYGKMYGDFPSVRFYLNPTPNSRNIEFDPTSNLLGGRNITAP
jgi:hypothetical protein